MKLKEIIELNEKADTAIITEELMKYKKALLVYYSNLFNCEPVLMVTDVFNACSYAKIVPGNELTEAIDEYVDGMLLDGEDSVNAKETILYQSRLLRDF